MGEFLRFLTNKASGNEVACEICIVKLVAGGRWAGRRCGCNRTLQIRAILKNLEYPHTEAKLLGILSKSNEASLCQSLAQIRFEVADMGRIGSRDAEEWEITSE